MVEDEELKEAVIGAIEWVEKKIQPGDKVALHPTNFEILDGYAEEEEEELKTKIAHCAFEELGFNPDDSKPIQEDKGVKKYTTNLENILLGSR